MIKIFDLVRRRESLDPGEFGPAWLAHGRALGASCPADVAPRGWLFYVVRPSKRPSEVDGISASWFADDDHWARFVSWAGEHAGADPVDHTRDETIRVEERVVTGPDYVHAVRSEPDTSVLLLFALLQRTPAVTRTGYADYWWNTHRLLADRDMPPEHAMLGYLHNYVDPADPCDWDGIGEIYESSIDAARARTNWVAGPGGQALRDDEGRFLRTDSRRVFVTDQHVLVTVTP